MDQKMIELVTRETKKTPKEGLEFLKKMADQRGLDHQGYSIGIGNIMSNPAMQSLERNEALIKENQELKQENMTLQKVFEKFMNKKEPATKKTAKNKE